MTHTNGTIRVNAIFVDTILKLVMFLPGMLSTCTALE